MEGLELRRPSAYKPGPLADHMRSECFKRHCTPQRVQVLGSLSLLFNPTGLVRSVRAGVADLIGLPLAALQNQSLAQVLSVWVMCQCVMCMHGGHVSRRQPGLRSRRPGSTLCSAVGLNIVPCASALCALCLQFISGVGLGSVSLVRHTLGALPSCPASH